MMILTYISSQLLLQALNFLWHMVKYKCNLIANCDFWVQFEENAQVKVSSPLSRFPRQLPLTTNYSTFPQESKPKAIFFIIFQTKKNLLYNFNPISLFTYSKPSSSPILNLIRFIIQFHHDNARRLLQLPHASAAANWRSENPLRPVQRRHAHRRLSISPSSAAAAILLILPPPRASIAVQPRAASGASAVGPRTQARRDMRRVV